MASKGLSNVYIDSLLKPICKKFKGTFSCDKIPSFSKHIHFSCIINLSRHDEIGTHFIAIYYNRSKIYYFDSLNLPVENDYIISFLQKYRVPIVKNDEAYQCDTSDFCGYYCCFYIMLAEYNTPMLTISRIFRNTTCEENDILIIELMKYMILL